MTNQFVCYYCGHIFISESVDSEVECPECYTIIETPQEEAA